MPWFRVDDSAHAHPKLRGAGTAAIGLWALGGSYAAQYLTDGRVHAHWIKTNATTPQLRKLTAAGLWHARGHGCPRCPQPAEGDYQIHDFLIYNRSREQVLKEREKATAKKRDQRSGSESKTNRSGNERDSNAKRDGIDDESKTNPPRISDDFAGQRSASPGDANMPRARATQPSPTPLPPTEVELASYAGAHDHPADRCPEFARPLRDRLTAAGIVVRWELQPAEWTKLHAIIKRSGESMLAAAAARAAQRTDIGTARYLLRVWSDLPPAPAPGTAPAVADSTVIPFRDRQQQATDDLFDRAFARAAALDAAEEAAQ